MSFIDYPATVANDATTVPAVFHDIQVKFVETTGRKYLQMKLRNGLQSFACDVDVSRRGLRKCAQIQKLLGLPMSIEADAYEAMRAVE